MRLKKLETEDAQMQRIIARQTLEIDAMRNLVSKNGWPSERQELWALQAD